MKKPSLIPSHTRLSKSLRGSFIRRHLVPSLVVVLGLPCATTASAVTEIFNTAGTTNWLCPAGVTSITVECWGGGGAGGSSFINGGTANAGGGGGGGGAYAKLVSVPVTPGSTYAVTIPAAATSPASGFANNARYDGSAVSFTGDGPVTLTANGGQGGQCRIVTTASASTGSSGTGGAAGVGFDAVSAGGNGGVWTGGNGAGGGGGAGDLGAGGVPTPSSNGSFGAGGSGSDADHTGGSGGAARNGVGNGGDAASPGGGGGGAKSTTTSTIARRGGNGGLGRIILTYTLPVAPFVVKADVADSLNLGSSWVGTVAPDATKVGKWNNIVTTANTTDLGADATWAGIAIENPAGLVTINGTNTLTLGGAAVDIDLSTTPVTPADLVLNCPLALSDAHVWNVAATRTVTLNGQVSGAFTVAKQGAGTAILSSTANSYTGDTTVTAGTLQLGASDVIPSGAATGNVQVDGTLDLNGRNETVNGLSGSGIIDNRAAATTSTLTVGSNNAGGTFSGVLKETAGALNLVKTGTGLQNLAGANTFTGSVTVNGGTLVPGNINALKFVSGITLADGTMLQSDLTSTVIPAPVTLGASGTTSKITPPNLPADNVNATTYKTTAYNGKISGGGNLTLTGVNIYNQYGLIILGAQNDYTGSTLITCESSYLAGTSNPGNTNIFVRSAVDNALPATTVLTLDGGDGASLAGAPRYADFDLNGFDQTLAGLNNVAGRVSRRAQQIANRSTSSVSTLTINNTAACTYTTSTNTTSAGGICLLGGTTSNTNLFSSSNMNLVKGGTGTFTVTGDGVYYVGNTTVNQGILSLSSLRKVVEGNDASTVTVAATGATLNLGYTGTDTVDKLFIGTTQKAAGVYGALASGAQFEIDQITGTGTLTVTTGPPAGDFASWITGPFAESIHPESKP